MHFFYFHNSSECTGTPECIGLATCTLSLLAFSRASMSLSVKVPFLSCQKLGDVNSQQKNKVILDGRFVFYYIDSAYLKR